MGNARRKRPVKSGTLTLSGNVTIKSISGIREKVLKKLESSEKLVLDLKNFEEGDLTFYQLLCSTLITADKLKKRVVLKNLSSVKADPQSSAYGFCTGRNCNGSSEAACIWNRLN